MEEILLRHRALIDAAVRSLEENTPIDGFLGDLHARVAALRLREPSFWELRVVEHIHSVVSAELKSGLRNGGARDADAVRVKETVCAQLSDQLARLLELLDQPQHQRGDADQQHERFLDAFWQSVAQLEGASTSNQTAEAEEDDAPTEQASYEAITFDDLQLEAGSVNSAPSMDEIPQILEAFNSLSNEDRRAALHRLEQISPLELVHCAMLFMPIVQGLCSLLLDSEQDVRKEALRLLYSVINQVEDSAQFLDLYFVVVDWVGSKVSAKELCIAPSDLFSDCDSTIRAVDALRLLHLMMCRVPYHWIHISTEMLARVICSTFVVLLVDPDASTNSKVCRPVDVLAVIDPEAMWFAKWALKVPSRAQLFASLDETGFISAFMYAMTRIRPFEAYIEPLERARTANMLAILATCARFEVGQHILSSWTKLPAHLQQQARYKEWLGPEKQFRLDAVPDENDRLFTFYRTDRTINSTHGMELEDGGPLGDHATVGIAMSAIVLHLFNESESETLHACLRSACQSITKRLSHQDDMSLLFELILQCGMGGQNSAIGSTIGTEELEERDPWFPFRRPKSIETVAKYIVDAATKRSFLSTPSFIRRCARVFEGLVESVTKLTSMTPRLVSAIARCLQGYLNQQLDEDSNGGIQAVLANVHHMMKTTTTPFTVGTAFVETSLLSQLSRMIQKMTGRTTQNAAFNLVRAIAESSSSMHSLAELGLWQECVQHFVGTWQADGDLDVRVLQLLLHPSASEIFFQSEAVQITLRGVEQACVLDLDTGDALNSSPSQAPFQLRQLLQTIASLRAALASQFASRVFTNSDTKMNQFLAQSVRQHNQGTCRSSPQREDLCTFGYELLTAAAGCIPSMVGFFELMRQCEARSLSPDDDDSISACSWLALSMTSSLNHVSGHQSHWTRPRPLYKFSVAVMAKQDPNPISRRASSSAAFKFSPTTTCTLEQMMASISESKTNHVPLDMVMLSQATWEILADVEKISSRDVDSYRALTNALGNLIYALAMSGQSKIGEGEPSQFESGVRRVRSVDSNPPDPATPASFPSDGERKLMNIYYKDYCSRLGLKATPTMLHVLSKVFGTAAMDCFSCTLLMILDQTHSENHIIEFLQYCASCPSMYALWPRIADTRSDQQLPALLPLAQAAEMILEIEFPQIFATLRLCHCSVLTLVLRWHSQCYWNYLPWDSILIMVYLTFLYGVEFQAYFFVVVIKHFEPTIRAIVARNGDDTARAYVETLQTPIEGFRFHTARNLFLTLRSTYHDRIQQILRR